MLKKKKKTLLVWLIQIALEWKWEAAVKDDWQILLRWGEGHRDHCRGNRSFSEVEKKELDTQVSVKATGN